MKYKKIFFFTVLGMLSCDDIFEKDISKEVINIRTPQNGLITSVHEQRFWWDEVDGATQYNIKIVSPDFDDALTLSVDTVISNTSLRVVLQTGKYEWCVTGRNSAYRSESSCRTLEITE